jgi:RND family efflux transporter MFP subunit
MVKKGDILVAIDSEILDAQINSAKANLSIAKLDFENAKKDYERYKKLREQKTVSQQTYDNSFLKFNTTQQNILVSESKLKELEVQKTKKFVKAPYDGIIVSKSIEKAEWANAGKVVGTIVDTSSIDLTFNLPTSYVYKLNKDEDYSIKIKDKTISSKLYAAIPKGDSRTRTFPVKFKAKVQNEFLYDGMEAAISLPRNKKQESLVVPRDAVIKRFGQNVVFIDRDSKAVMLSVKIIGYNTTSVAVSAKGLYEGANVVVKGNERIFPNQPIKSLNK